MQELTLLRPDDWHLHLRDGSALAPLSAASARCFARAIVMPNLRPPVVSTEQALAYRERILATLPPGTGFDPLMTLYLTDRTPVEEVRRARASARIYAVKLYPAGATTHSEAGVTDVQRLAPVLEAMAELGLPLLVHGEVSDPAVDVFDRERVFIDRVLAPLVERHPDLKVVLEHVTTEEGVRFVRAGSDRLAATVTAHHLLLERNAMFHGGLNPHHYCLPVLKRERHRAALREAVVSGDRRFFLGTDSAPHPRDHKEAALGCAGIYTAPAALELYAEVFESLGCLDRLEAFASHHGPDFYGLARNTGTLRLVKSAWTMPAELPLGEATVVPFRAGEPVAWRIAS